MAKTPKTRAATNLPKSASRSRSSTAAAAPSAKAVSRNRAQRAEAGSKGGQATATKRGTAASATKQTASRGITKQPAARASTKQQAAAGSKGGQATASKRGSANKQPQASAMAAPRRRPAAPIPAGPTGALQAFTQNLIEETGLSAQARGARQRQSKKLFGELNGQIEQWQGQQSGAGQGGSSSAMAPDGEAPASLAGPAEGQEGKAWMGGEGQDAQPSMATANAGGQQQAEAAASSRRARG